MYKISVFDTIPNQNCQLSFFTCAFKKASSRLVSILNWTCFRQIVVCLGWGVDLPNHGTSVYHIPRLFPHKCS